ncbi:MAG: hypothetical protein KH760_06500 [Clostridiales bacterium]|jgi:hypothetical protein|nr:hypothetical protein [Clostridiales bacterium]PWM83046.1 MAG: hypothetical protein DBY41_00910 [Clostridium sp.]
MIVIGRLEGNGFYSSRELMEELIVAVQSLGQKGCFDYIQLGTTIMSVLISVIAIIFAIRVPKQIADRQDRISLFEKRYDCYTTIQKFLVVAKQIENEKTKKAIQVAFRMYLGNAEDITKNINLTTFLVFLKQKESILISGEFLFNKYDAKLLQEILSVSLNLVRLSSENDNNKLSEILSDREEVIILKNQYCELCNKFIKDYFPFLEEDLKINFNKSR